MPNWCSNTLYATGSAIEADELRSFMTTARSKFDFRAIVPMPPDIEHSESSSEADLAWQLKYGDWHGIKNDYSPDRFASREDAIEAARAVDRWRPMVFATNENPFPVIPARSFDDLADAVQELVVKYGHPDWYSWACAHWGTKWSACRAGWMSPARAAKRDAHQAAYFDTAWSPPVPVVVHLSAHFPDSILRLAYDVPESGLRGFVTAHAGIEIAGRREEYGPVW